MLPEYVFYFFIFPWLTVISSVVTSMLLFLFAGIFAQLLNYLPAKKSVGPS